MEKTEKQLAIYARTSRYLDGNIHTIDQQIQAGIEFAKRHNYTEENYTIFSDEGKSAVTINDDDDDPYAERDSFRDLMKRVTDGTIDAIWVWENSRLSRNPIASAVIYNTINRVNRKRLKLGQDNIELWIQETKYDLENPTQALTKSLMDAFAIYEASLIKSRTTRGLHNSINNGKRSFSHFYGYTKGERNEKGNYIYYPNEFELDNVRRAYKMFKEGKTLREISLSLVQVKPERTQDIIKISTKWGRILAHKEYTGWALNTEGLKIEHQFEEGKIENLSVLNDVNKYWVKSKVYTEELISIEDWIKVREELALYKKIQRDYKDEFGKNYVVDSTLATGLIKCHCCNSKYFFYFQNYKLKDGSEQRMPYYKHQGIFNNTQCSQHPKTIKIEKIDYILGFFYFFYVLIFDDSEARKEKTLVSIKEQKNILKTEIKDAEVVVDKYKRLVDSLTEYLENNPNDVGSVLPRLTDYEKRYDSAVKKYNEKKTELLNLEMKFSGSQAKKDFRVILEDLQFFFMDGNNAKHRMMLNKIIKSAVIYQNYLVIQTETLYFVFKIDTKDKSLLPYKPLPREFLDKPEFTDRFNEVWNRFKNNELNYKEPEVQEYLKKTFNWKTFVVSDENIKLEQAIPFPAGSTVIYFDETTAESSIHQKKLEAQRRYREKHRKLQTEEEKQADKENRRQAFKDLVDSKR